LVAAVVTRSVTAVSPSADIVAPLSVRRSIPWYRRLYTLVLASIVLGALLGYFFPDFAQRLRPLGDLFIRLIRMMIEPIIFTTVIVGVGRMGSMKEVGRVGLKALIYFETLTGIALILGLVVVNLYRPGDGITLDVATLDPGMTATYTADAGASAHPTGIGDTFLNIVPTSVIGAFAAGNTLQVLFFSILLGLGFSTLGARGAVVVDFIDQLSKGLFAVIRLIMAFAPLGALGAMAFTIGKYGLGTLHQLGLLLAGVYSTCLLFIFVVLQIVARLAGFSLWRFLVYIREEILIVLGTSTSESALPRLMVKLEELGCSKSVVGLVVPTGYSFNLDGTSIYLSMAALFIAQAAHVTLSWGQQLEILGLLLLTSKGAAAVTGGGFVALAATLSSMHTLPVAGLALLLGVDRFMSEARALTNLIGNGVATIIVAKWERSLDERRMHTLLGRQP
jgi:aerobic C4-dicarboxylate transport protein